MAARSLQLGGEAASSAGAGEIALPLKAAFICGDAKYSPSVPLQLGAGSSEGGAEESSFTPERKCS